MTAAAIVGGGPAGLIAAQTLARAGVSVTVYDRMPSVPRKFLLAGHGGMNITHTEERAGFLARYGDAADRLAPMLDAFGPTDLREWCAGLGEPTFVGTSGRVFPQSFRATPLVRAWLRRLGELGVTLERRQRWTGWTDGGALVFDDVNEVAADVVVFALGGASWPRLGADGGWVRPFVDRGVAVTPLRAANVAVRVAWSQWFASRFEGVPLKNVALTVAGRRVPGDAMVTRTGLEGGPVYALGAEIRDALDAGRCVVDVDLRPDVTVEQLTSRLRSRRPKDSASNWLRRSIGLDPVGIALVREAGALPADPQAMAELVKAVPVPVVATMPIDRAISSAGGIAWSEVDESLMLRALPGTFVAGEMLDWEAPTGGYLLQASFSTGVVAARGALAWLSRPIPFEVHESGALLHGTKADLRVGDLLVPGRRSNYGGGRTAGHVYLTETLDAAAWGAELAVGDGPGRIYVVEPMGPIEDDPNVTDKRFPGNPTRSFRTRDPVRVVGELEDWSGHTPGQIQAMRGGLADLERQGLAEIDD